LASEPDDERKIIRQHPDRLDNLMSLWTYICILFLISFFFVILLLLLHNFRFKKKTKKRQKLKHKKTKPYYRCKSFFFTQKLPPPDRNEQLKQAETFLWSRREEWTACKLARLLFSTHPPWPEKTKNRRG
jgi:hypothetical protein